MRVNIPAGGTWLPESLEWLSPYARIVHWYNTGAAFGLFKEGGMVFTVLAFIVIGAILYYYPQVERSDWPLRLAMSMQFLRLRQPDRPHHDRPGHRFYFCGHIPCVQYCGCEYQPGLCGFIVGCVVE